MTKSKMKDITHEINYRDDEFAKECDGQHPCVRVSQYEDQEILDNLIDPDKMITNSENIEITFDYPLTKPATFTFDKKGGFTRKDIFRCIYEGYNYIYLTEEDPGMIPGTYNRAYSEGPYGIWGHIIEDLFIEGVAQKDDKFFTLCMGS